MSPAALARLPTPTHRLERIGRAIGCDLWVQRDDLTGFLLSGNKVRKLEYLLAEAVATGCDTVITCGGMQSNHCRATAVAARQLGLHPVLLLRGERPAIPDGNLLIDALVGATVVTCTPDEYRFERQQRMAALADELVRAGKRPYVIPEGGSNALGARGYQQAAAEVLSTVGTFDAVFVAVGSGGTLAGLVMGPDIGPIRGVAVCDDRTTFVDVVVRIAGEAGVDIPPPGRRWDVLEAYRGPGYAVPGPDTWATIRRVAVDEGLLLDPVYTGKAFEGLLAEVAAGRVGGRVLFWHTGGGFGVFGRGAEVAG